MDLIVWRHAQAQDPSECGDDLERRLTARGQKDAARIGRWLDRHLPDDTRILVSPAARCEQTAQALRRTYRICPELAPGATPGGMLALAQWPAATAPVLLVGHQPALGALVALLLGISAPSLSIRKGALWWLRHGTRAAEERVIVHAVMNPDRD